MIWKNPEWLWGGLVLLLLWLMTRSLLERRKKALRQKIDPTIFPKIAPAHQLHRDQRKNFLFFLGLVFLVLALAGPRWGYREETTQYQGMDLLIAVDLSKSMDVEDVVPSRIKKAKHFLGKIFDGLRGDRVGLIGFAGSAFLASPLTTDIDYVREIVESLDTSVIRNQGTDIGLALQIAAEALERGAESVDRPSEDEKVNQAVLLISDGEDLEGAALDGANRIKESGVSLYVVGIGSSVGKPIPIFDEKGRKRGYKTDDQGKVVMSQFRPEALQKLSSKADGQYWTLSSSEKEAELILNSLGGEERTELGERKFRVYYSRYQFPLVVALVLFFLELLISQRARFSILSKASLIFIFIGFLGLDICFTKNAMAQLDDFEIYEQTKRGLEAFRNEDLESAKKHFGSAQALKPDSPLLKYNQSVIQGMEKDWDAAISGFEQSYRNAPSDQPEVKGRALYNLGSALAQKNQDQKAIQTLVETIDYAKQSQDPELEEMARQRIQEILQKRKLKQKQDQDSNDDRQPEKGQDQAAKNDQSEGKNDSDEEKPEPQRYSQNKGFKSEKLDKEDAERVMSDLSNREKELKMRLRRQADQKGGARRRKDW